MGRRRERLDRRLEDQGTTRRKNAGRKARERVRKENFNSERAERLAATGLKGLF